ncbi:hypothetical protein J5N97_024058 [Dioscorea zingiberensis]|uniref:Uncharacterized protein n=1 Tax=Dioscorea zingiberensis TaxID=325984 RepID=A0A9D5H8E9_9LILI|nr:hypothetical protein J5N97_024058 [Dioscorea zingiberensis]
MSTSLDPHLTPIISKQSPKDPNKDLSKGGGSGGGDDDDGECRTPTSVESRLPSISITCPPAPRKPRRVIRCKRRLTELEFFLVPHRELESLFRPPPPPPSKKLKLNEI